MHPPCMVTGASCDFSACDADAALASARCAATALAVASRPLGAPLPVLLLGAGLGAVSCIVVVLVRATLIESALFLNRVVMPIAASNIRVFV